MSDECKDIPHPEVEHVPFVRAVFEVVFEKGHEGHWDETDKHRLVGCPIAPNPSLLPD